MSTEGSVTPRLVTLDIPVQGKSAGIRTDRYEYKEQYSPLPTSAEEGTIPVQYVGTSLEYQYRGQCNPSSDSTGVN